MKMKIITLTGALLLMAIICLAVQASGQIQDQDDLIKQLASDNIEQRINALKILKESGSAPNEQVKKALIDLVDKENKIVEAKLRESDVQIGIGEYYGEYLSELVSIVERHADLNDRRTLSILLHNFHAGAGVLDQGEAIVPLLTGMLKEDFFLNRKHAVQMLRRLVNDYRSKLSDATVAAIEQALIESLRDHHPMVRLAAEQLLPKVSLNSSLGQIQTELIRQLDSADWRRRAEAFQKLHLDVTPTGAETAIIMDALLPLLDKENSIMTSGAISEGKEEYARYYDLLLETVSTHSDIANNRVLAIVAHSSYSLDSPLVQKLLSQGEMMCVQLSNMSRSKLPGERLKAIILLEELVTSYRHTIDNFMMEVIKQIFDDRSQDSDEMVRKRAQQALSKIGN